MYESDDSYDDGKADYEACMAEDDAGELEDLLKAYEAEDDWADDSDMDRMRELVDSLAGFPYRELVKRAQKALNGHGEACREMADLDRSERFMRIPMNEPESMGD
jgi:hypothetical protein